MWLPNETLQACTHASCSVTHWCPTLTAIVNMLAVTMLTGGRIKYKIASLLLHPFGCTDVWMDRQGHTAVQYNKSVIHHMTSEAEAMMLLFSRVFSGESVSLVPKFRLCSSEHHIRCYWKDCYSKKVLCSLALRGQYFMRSIKWPVPWGTFLFL